MKQSTLRRIVIMKNISRPVTISLILYFAGMAHAEPQYLNSGQVLPSTLPFSEAVQVGDLLMLSGQIGNIPGTLELAEGGITGEAHQVMENIRTSLGAHGYALNNLVKCTVFLANMEEWDAFNDVYATYFDAGRYPARSAFGGVDLAFNARVEVECIGAK